MLTTTTNLVLQQLQDDGIVAIPNLISNSVLRGMQQAFESKLRHLRWNDVDGYERTEKYRHMVQDVLALDQGFVDLAIHPLVKDTLNEYLGTKYELVEAKGWKSLPTNKDFHGWHGDAWYDQGRVKEFIPREVKVAFYLTDVNSGYFEYIKGSHRKQVPRMVRSKEINGIPDEQLFKAKGPAGTAIFFDTSGIHRQSVPMLQPRHAVFYNYHDPSIPLQQEDIDYYRYHPLILNAAFLGNLSSEDQRILGFGNKTNYIPSFTRKLRHAGFQRIGESLFAQKLEWDKISDRVKGRLKKIISTK